MKMATAGELGVNELRVYFRERGRFVSGHDFSRAGPRELWLGFSLAAGEAGLNKSVTALALYQGIGFSRG